jgi:hypothetical protein
MVMILPVSRACVQEFKAHAHRARNVPILREATIMTLADRLDPAGDREFLPLMLRYTAYRGHLMVRMQVRALVEKEEKEEGDESYHHHAHHHLHLHHHHPDSLRDPA